MIPRPMPRLPVKTWPAAIRSALRRYPRELLGSLRGGGDPGPPTSRGLTGPRLLKAWSRIERDNPPLAVAWLGHCTVLIRIAGRTILTDPVLSDRIGVRIPTGSASGARGAGAGARTTIGLSRLCPIPIRPERLPAIDLVLLSHAHFDHLDRPTLEAIANPRTLVVTARQTRRLIPPGFERVIELDWMEALEVAGLRLVAIKPKHWGARTAWDIHRGYNSYLIQPVSSADPAVLFAGDTALTHAFDDLRGVDLAIFGIGAYAPWEHAHATPEQVWRMFSAMRAGRLLPVHHGTFDLGEEAPGEALARLLAAAGDERDRVVPLPVGGVARLAPKAGNG
jgi:L-ascorbate metabolism protein UlaG (beta-lactamase superfamily)